MLTGLESLVEFCTKIVWTWAFAVVGRDSMTDSYSVGVIGLFKLFI